MSSEDDEYSGSESGDNGYNEEKDRKLERCLLIAIPILAVCFVIEILIIVFIINGSNDGLDNQSAEPGESLNSDSQSFDEVNGDATSDDNTKNNQSAEPGGSLDSDSQSFDDETDVATRDDNTIDSNSKSLVSKHKTEIIVISVLVGLVLLSVACVFGFVYRRNLRQIRTVTAHAFESVTKNMLLDSPPQTAVVSNAYVYQDLKRDFSEPY